MKDVTQLLNAIEAGDPQAAAQLLPLVYDELRRLAAAQMARERPGQTLAGLARKDGSGVPADAGPAEANKAMDLLR